MRQTTIFAAVLLASLSVTATMSGQTDGALTERERAIHALNRLAFGPRPGDVDRVLETGVDRWIEQQLHPETIDDELLDDQLASLETLQMSSEELFDTYQRPLIEARAEMRRRASEDDEVDGDRPMGDLGRARRLEHDPRTPVTELTVARLTRATFSERQLNEVMVDFWMNHFNVFAGKQPVGVLLTEYEYETIRPNIWGSFEQLLAATAKSPAMLAYLDNMRSVAEIENRRSRRSRYSMRPSRGGPGMRRSGARGGVSGRGMAEQQRQRLQRAGLNENYARELMELHTLGVDGGYSQDDVIALARILTGWSVQRPDEGTGFVFRSELHDVKAKEFLGTTFRAGGGFEEGERAIRMLATHPSTARTIASKLVRYLVSDDPPVALVDRVAKRFSESGGDLRATVREIVTSDEFFARENYRTKTKTPIEFIVSSLRATSARAEPRFLALQLRELGQPLYLCQPPTGYSDLAEDWISSTQLMSRINFATALVSGRVAEIATPDDDIAGAALRLTGEPLSDSTRRTIDQQLAAADLTDVGRGRLLTGLILGSPEFQRQ